MATKTALLTPSPAPRHNRGLRQSQAAMQQAEINQQLAVTYNLKNLLWTKIIEQAGPELRRLLEAYGSLQVTEILFPSYIPPDIPLHDRIKWMVRSNIEAERLIGCKGKGHRDQGGKWKVKEHKARGSKGKA